MTLVDADKGEDWLDVKLPFRESTDGNEYTMICRLHFNWIKPGKDGLPIELKEVDLKGLHDGGTKTLILMPVRDDLRKQVEKLLESPNGKDQILEQVLEYQEKLSRMEAMP